MTCSVQGHGASKSRKIDLQNLQGRHDKEEGNDDKSNKKSQRNHENSKTGLALVLISGSNSRNSSSENASKMRIFSR